MLPKGLCPPGARLCENGSRSSSRRDGLNLGSRSSSRKDRVNLGSLSSRRDGVNLAQDFSPGSALRLDALVPGGTTESVPLQTNSIASQAGFHTVLGTRRNDQWRGCSQLMSDFRGTSIGGGGRFTPASGKLRCRGGVWSESSTPTAMDKEICTVMAVSIARSIVTRSMPIT